jgi:hypothetical protein
MRPAAAALLILVMAVAFGCGQKAPPGWTAYNSPEGRYSVFFPGKPELSTNQSPAHTGETLTEYFAICTDPDAGGDVVYNVTYFDLAPQMAYSFDEARDGYVKAVNGTLQSEKNIQFSGYPGRELKATTNSSGKDFNLVTRIILVEKRVYMVQFIFTKAYDSARAADKSATFFNSFRLTSSH